MNSDTETASGESGPEGRQGLVGLYAGGAVSRLGGLQAAEEVRMWDSDGLSGLRAPVLGQVVVSMACV